MLNFLLFLCLTAAALDIQVQAFIVPHTASPHRTPIFQQNPNIPRTTIATRIFTRSNDNDDDENSNLQPHLMIEYCTGCKWLYRSAWMMQELLTTFEEELSSVSLVPSRASPGGVFNIRIYYDHEKNEEEDDEEEEDNNIVWDRKRNGGFPDAKTLKQKVRDVIDPDKFLGHSDTNRDEKEVVENNNHNKNDILRGKGIDKEEDCIECNEQQDRQQQQQQQQLGDTTSGTLENTRSSTTSNNDISTMDNNNRSPNHHHHHHRLTIRYSTKGPSLLLLRSSWMAQELLTHFEKELDSVMLRPLRVSSSSDEEHNRGGGGKEETFIVSIHDKILWDLKKEGGFPEIETLKQKVHDILVSAQRGLDHPMEEEEVDGKRPSAEMYNDIVIEDEHNDEDDDDDEEDDEKNNSELRKYFGVL